MRHHRLWIVLETLAEVAQPLFTRRRQLRHLGLQVAVHEGHFLAADDGFYSHEWWAGLDMPEDHRAKPGEQAFEHWNHPRERVSWYDAIDFCRWLTAKTSATPALAPQMPPGEGLVWSFTLPTEWQWEKAARGYDGRVFPWGDEYVSGFANINETYSEQRVGDHYLGKTSTVGMYPQGVSPYGIHDMSGNVWE